MEWSIQQLQRGWKRTKDQNEVYFWENSSWCSVELYHVIREYKIPSKMKSCH